MSQNSLVVANGTGASVRSAINNALNSIVTNNSGSGAPSTTYAYMLWADTTNDLLKIRNAANTAWITIGKLSLTNLGLAPILRGFIWGMTLSNNGTDATNDIDIAVGSCASDDSTDANRVLLNPGAMTKQLDATWAAGTNAGGRVSSESLVNGTWHVYAFRRSNGTDDYFFSQSLTPTVPDSGTHKRRIGSILRESASIVSFVQYGDHFQRKSPTLDVNVNNPGTSAALRTVLVPTGLTILSWLRVGSISTSVAAAIWIQDPALTDSSPGSTASPLCSFNVSTAAAEYQEMFVYTNTSAQVRSRFSASDANANLYIATLGWVDRRGRIE